MYDRKRLPVHDSVLRQMRKCVRHGRYVVTVHADEEMAADVLAVFDVEHAVLTGNIVVRQKDRDSGEWKYGIRGKSLAGRGMMVVCKLTKARILVIITVYLASLTNGKI